jgi:hypothetical protein
MHLNYNFIKKQYKDKFNLMYMDTDSFIYEIFTNDFYKDMKYTKYIIHLKKIIEYSQKSNYKHVAIIKNLINLK